MKSSRVRNVLLLLGLGLAAVFVWRAGPRLVLDMLSSVGAKSLVVVGIYAVHLLIRAAALWRAAPDGVRYIDVVRIRISGEAVEMLTFSGPFLAEPTKGWLLKRLGLPAADAFAAVAIEYLLYTVVSACLTVFAFSVLLDRGLVPAPLRPAAILVLIFACLLIATFVFAVVTRVGLIVPIVRRSRVLIGQRRAERAVQQLAPIEDRLVAFLHDCPGRHAEVLALEAAAHLLLVFEVGFVLAALGYPLPWRDRFVIEGGVKFISVAFAFVPGQFGAAEGIYGLLVSALGVPAAAGLTLMLMRRFRDFVVAVAGLVALAFFDGD